MLSLSVREHCIGPLDDRERAICLFIVYTCDCNQRNTVQFIYSANFELRIEAISVTSVYPQDGGSVRCCYDTHVDARLQNRRFPCDVISSRLCKSSHFRPPCWFPLCMVQYRKTQENVPKLLIEFIHVIPQSLAKLHRVTRISPVIVHTLG